MKLEYTLLEMEHETNIEALESFIELGDNFLYWKAEYYCDAPVNHEDLSQGWENRMKSYETWVKKESVIGVGKAFRFSDDKWQVFIDASGLAGTIEVFFMTEKEASLFSKQIFSWMLSKT